MSNHLAIATVTAVLHQLVNNAASKEVGSVNVENGRPNAAATAGNHIHLFLYQVVPNGAMRNNDLPTRSSNGQLVRRPVVALDLQYLLAFYGSTELEAQVMLGAVVRELNSRPVLTRQMIEDGVASLPQQVLSGSNLAESMEQVKFTPHPVSLDELSKLWSIFFQTPYALSVAYQASVVLIEAEERPRPILPVLRRGKEDQGVDVLLGPFPIITQAYFGMPGDRILTVRPPSFPAARLGLAVILFGQHLKGHGLVLRLRHARPELRNHLGQELVCDLLVSAQEQSPTEFKVLLPDPGSGTTQPDWAPGVYTVTVVKPSPTGGGGITSNGLPIALAPIIQLSGQNTETVIIGGEEKEKTTLTITCQPRVHAGQQAVLLFVGMEIVGKIDPGNADQLTFDIIDAPKVDQALVRLRVDGIESMPYVRDDNALPPRFSLDPDPGLRVTIP